MTQEQHESLLMQDTEETVVIFRKFKDDGSIIALFPELDYESGHANWGKVQSYMHVGQHGEADYANVVTLTTPAQEHEYEDLAEELASIGYNLRILARKPMPSAPVWVKEACCGKD